ncbi:methyl-accepting chemotaxis protein [Paraburkholderia sp.]|uniref:methyl-accepting chemotaxis protein n=1 Tax=Paraburkholderia sp. TaxID=1926495 RepID=UPI002D2BA95E|nr:methyl-accepting chemotaxis protein [Paraburkholderia sp.]HZZ06765.1 methyl-accepting chemotaxis protein [Paraburkholderia sp.]
MRKFVATIRFRMALAFGVPAFLTLALTFMANKAIVGQVRDAGSGAPVTTRLLVIAVVTVTMLIYGYVHLYRVVCDGLGRQTRSFQYLAETLDLSRRSSARRMDEFGRGAVWFDRFMHRVEDTVLAVQASTESVSSATRQIAAGNMDLSSRTEEQAASLEQTAASMAELTETVAQNTDSAREADGLASRASSLADRGNNAVQALVATITRIEAESRRISDITALIEGIAFQTNILALNAAVEAARAGDQGRGFAVVAGEVRVLAQRSSSAAKEIKAVIGSSAAMVRDGSSQAQEAGAAIEQVKYAIGEVSTLVAQISLASGRQSLGAQQVAAAVAKMDQVTQQNAALVEQAAAAAQSLDEQVANVRAVLTQFRVSDRSLMGASSI